VLPARRLTLEIVANASLPAELCDLIPRIGSEVAARSRLRGRVTVQICPDAEMRRLNREFRGVDRVTDVLAFPDTEAEPTDPAEAAGDVAISYSRVVAQAQAHGHSHAREFGYLLTHALLHLAGESHEGEVETRRMRACEEAVLGSLGLTREPTASQA
jgi:probable rRNA maturation factor